MQLLFLKLLFTLFILGLVQYCVLSNKPGIHNIDDVVDEHKMDKATAQLLATSLSARHFDKHGAKWPSQAFTNAVREAAMLHEQAGVHGNSMRSVVIMAMANDLAMNSTVPLFLQSIRDTAVTAISPAASGRSLADHLVLACSSHSAADMCRDMGLGTRCVVDVDMALGSRPLPFHSIGFNMIGFAKIKYILNTLALGSDIIFLDTDVLVFQDFVPYMLGTGADIAALVEKCRVVDDRASYTGKPVSSIPNFNIGATYFRSSPGVTRCVHSWLFDMRMEVRNRPSVWDQDVFRKVMFHCTVDFGLRLHGFSPRLLNSHCYKPCGCTFSDQDVLDKVDKPRLPSRSVNGTCRADAVRMWKLMHFPCAGEALQKSGAMQRYLSMARALPMGVLETPKLHEGA